MQEENEANCAQMNEDFAARTADVRADYEKQIAELKAQFEVDKLALIADKDAEKERLREDMQAQIDELKRMLEEEKLNMGAAGQRRENELLGQIEEMRKELEVRHQRIIVIDENQKILTNQVQERDNKIAALQHEITDLKAKIERLESDLFDATQSGDAAMNDLRELLRKTQ